jgi:hypothetical protein
LNAVPEREVPGRQRARIESYRVLGSWRGVTLSSKNAFSRFRCVHTRAAGVRPQWVAHSRLVSHNLTAPRGEWSSLAAGVRLGLLIRHPTAPQLHEDVRGN